jgi:hypothetical protein
MTGNPTEYKRLMSLIEQSSTSVVGVGVTAFNRIGPALFYPNYKIVCYKYGSDTEALSKYCAIKTIQKDWPETDLAKVNTVSILKHPEVKKYLSKQKNSKVFVYKSSKQITREVDKLGLTLIGNRPEIRDKYEDKLQFFNIGRRIGLPMIPGVQLKLRDLNLDSLNQVRLKLGQKLVFQLTDISMGGGKGTFYIFSDVDFANFESFLKSEQENRNLVNVNITKFISGPSPSVTGCVTRHGILTGPLQTQILDVPELGGHEGRSGVYQGHDWSYKVYDQDLQNQADKMAQTLGEEMFRNGYKGIFGLDLVIDEETNQVYPIECNPRYTGAFPVFSMLQHAYNEVPLDMFQLLEFLNIDYSYNFEEVNKSWKQPKAGAHVVLKNPFEVDWTVAKGNLPAGVYRLKSNTLEKVRDGVMYQNLVSDDEFILTDGPPRFNQRVKPGLRIGKLIFKDRILASPGKITDWASEVVTKVYEGFILKPENGNNR